MEPQWVKIVDKRSWCEIKLTFLNHYIESVAYAFRGIFNVTELYHMDPGSYVRVVQYDLVVLSRTEQEVVLGRISYPLYGRYRSSIINYNESEFSIFLQIALCKLQACRIVHFIINILVMFDHTISPISNIIIYSKRIWNFDQFLVKEIIANIITLWCGTKSDKLQNKWWYIQKIGNLVLDLW